MTESIFKKESKKHHNCTIFVGIGTQYGHSNLKKKTKETFKVRSCEKVEKQYCTAGFQIIVI